MEVLISQGLTGAENNSKYSSHYHLTKQLSFLSWAYVCQGVYF